MDYFKSWSHVDRVCLYTIYFISFSLIHDLKLDRRLSIHSEAATNNKFAWKNSLSHMKNVDSLELA